MRLPSVMIMANCILKGWLHSAVDVEYDDNDVDVEEVVFKMSYKMNATQKEYLHINNNFSGKTDKFQF